MAQIIHGLPIPSDTQRISTSNLINEQREQTFDLEKAQAEIELLREQIKSLQQSLVEQLWQQRETEQELHYANLELELTNAEIQRSVEAKILFLKEIKEFTRTLQQIERLAQGH